MRRANVEESLEIVQEMLISNHVGRRVASMEVTHWVKGDEWVIATIMKNLKMVIQI